MTVNMVRFIAAAACAFVIGVLMTTVSAFGCDSDSELVVYEATFDTFWSEDRFPKQYPLYRPPAQWRPLIGKCVRHS